MRNELLAGFTTLRDLGTEGAGYADVGLKAGGANRNHSGPRLLVATRAIVRDGSYARKGYAPSGTCRRAPRKLDGVDGLTRVVRDRSAKARIESRSTADYRWGAGGLAHATFTLEELKLAVEVFERAPEFPCPRTRPRRKACGARFSPGSNQLSTAMAGHAGDLSLDEREGHGAPADIVGCRRDADKRKLCSNSARCRRHHCSGSDVGVFAHGDNAREIERMVAWGMAIMMRCAPRLPSMPGCFTWRTRLDGCERTVCGSKSAVDGDPTHDVSALRRVRFEWKTARSTSPVLVKLEDVATPILDCLLILTGFGEPTTQHSRINPSNSSRKQTKGDGCPRASAPHCCASSGGNSCWCGAAPQAVMSRSCTFSALILTKKASTTRAAETTIHQP